MSATSATPATSATSATRGRAANSEPLLALLFAASGCAALIYEVVWFHLLRLVIGASALSIAIVLAGFMGGMFFGSLLVGRVVPTRWHPLRTYAALEVTIGILGLLMPVVVPAARSLYVGLFGYGALGIALRAGVAGSMLLLPTALMGASFPAVARRYAGNSPGLTRVAVLYGANTAGAVGGCLLTGFFLLPTWDVVVATTVAVALNLAAAAGALWLSHRSDSAAAPASPAPPAATEDATAPVAIRPSAPSTVYVVAALSGMTALGGQVVWTRLLSLLFGGTTYTFAIILSVFLGGLGIGSAIAAGAIRRGERGQLLASCQFALVAAIAYAGLMIAKVIPYTSTLRVVPVRTLQVLHTIHCVEVLLPAAILWGMSFPLAVATASEGHSDAGRASGAVYAANTVGAIVGALGTSLLSIPLWGTRASQQVLIAVAATSSALLYGWLYRAEKIGDPEAPRGTPPALIGAVAVVTAIVAIRMVPALPPLFQANGRYIWQYNQRDTVPYVGEGAASTVAVRESENHVRYFHVAGKVEASTDAMDLRTERVLGHLSALVHPRPESVLVVGLGAGVTAGTFVLHPEVKRIVICEIEARVLRAARFFAPENYSVLSDPRVTVINDDARHFLATTRERFDVITSDPIHPWVRGNSVLFSREYYAIVKQRLLPGGVATQWIPLYETNEEAIKIQMRTFMDAFPHGTVWNTQAGRGGYDVVVLGQTEATHIDIAGAEARIEATPALKKSLADVRIGSAVDLFASYSTGAADMAAWFRNIPVNRDLSLKLEYISGLACDLQRADPIYSSMTHSRTFPSDLFVASPEVETLRSRIGGG